MECQLRRINPLFYKILFGEEKVSVADYYVNHMGEQMQIYEIEVPELSQEERAAGFIMGLPQGDCFQLSYLYILPKKREQGYASQALQKLEQTISETQIELRLPESLKTFSVMEKIAWKLHYEQRDVVHLFQCYRDDFSTWNVYMDKHGSRMLEYLKEEGFAAMSVSNASERDINQLIHSVSNDFQNEMDPVPLLRGERGEFLPDYSWLVEKDGYLAAYCLVLRGDASSLIFEQISASAVHQGSGAIFMAFVHAMESYRVSDYTKTAYAVYESNTKSMAIARRLLRNVTSVEKKQYNYCRNLL